MARVFGCWCACDLSEWFGLLSPQKVDTFLLREPRGSRGSWVYAKPENVRVLFRIPNSPKGKVGNPRLSTTIDFLIYSAFLIGTLPFLLIFYEVFIFVAPPFFDTITVPILKVFRKKIFIISTDDWVAVASSPSPSFLKKIKLQLGRLLEVYAVKGATRVFAVSRHLVNLYKPYNENVFYVPNGADTEKIERIRPRRMFKEPTIAYLGGIETWRGIDLLIDAFRLVRQKIKAKLLIMGSGLAFEQMKKYAAQDPDIVFTGQVDHDVGISYLKGSKIAVIPNRRCLASETISSIKCFEYIACEIPSVVTDSGEHAYWTKKYGTGIIVEDSPHGLARGILKLMKSNQLYRKIKENCQKHKADVDFRNTRKKYVEMVKDDLKIEKH
jgi:glycosyltransferase involved in cell wall biosynthesis